MCRGRQKPDKMLQCEGLCKKYFHTWCVGLRAVPSGKWLCNGCSKAPTLNNGGRPRKARVNRAVESTRSAEDVQARRQWKMAMGISAVGDGDGPALSDSEDSQRAAGAASQRRASRLESVAGR